MTKYYVMGLTQEQVAGRALSQIGDAIREKFLSSAQAAIQNKPRPSTESMAIVRFEDPLTSPEFFKGKFKDYFSVLYLNQTAKDILDANGLNPTIIEEVEELPENIGTFISMPIFQPQ